MIALEEYRAMCRAAPDGYVVVDGEGKIQEANPKAEHLFGWSRDELVGSLVELLVPEALRAKGG